MKVLLVEDNPGDAALIRHAFSEVADGTIDLTHIDRLSAALEILGKDDFDAILLDLSLPDSHGFETLAEVRDRVSQTPIVVLTGLADEDLAIQAVQAGAQDYLVKGASGDAVLRALRYAIERHQMVLALRGDALIDDLTGLYNRRGFLTIAKQQLAMAARRGERLLVAIADLDGLKRLNDTYGHLEGDRAIVAAAKLLQDAFRDEDTVARLGGDEFAVVCLGADAQDGELLVGRVQENLAAYNLQTRQPLPLAMSIGFVEFDPDHPCAIDELIERADRWMYHHKRSKQTA